MSAPLIAALIFTVALLVVTAYFLMGSLPLLILKHDTPLDSRFIRGFYDTYYLAATFTAGATAVSYALAARPVLATGAAGLALLAHALRRKFIPKMDALREQIQASVESAVTQFRRMHLTAILVNLVQLVLVVASLITLSMQMR